ncbi:DUF1259 domain-containing protein [Neobacillus drentensis]|uniref:DUF1259 domain-containing protein n=1 Tax=Neobacillus drentensis TaxID=220684 RepID=UPI001F3315F0|nr:DUF1259 domain-containing protein [Neobacillus drentensis]ULT54492.1 DUF1259 domain-containing protein [Neobacillus drentensis]
MARRDVFENWFRYVNGVTETSSFGRDQREVEFESSSRTTGHHFGFESSSNFRGHESSERMTSTNRGEVREITASKCQRLADIIGGEVIAAAPVCTVMRLRDINATILGRRTRSPLALPFMLSFENNGLNLGESVVLQKELNRFIAALRKRGLIVTAFHNHWLFENPRLMYIHWENVGMSAEEFARNSISAAREAGLF